MGNTTQHKRTTLIKSIDWWRQPPWISPVCLQSAVVAWRILWAKTPAGVICTFLLQVQVFDRLYDRMVTGGCGLAGPCIAFKPPRRRPRRRCQQHYQHYNHQRKNEPGHRGHLWTVCSCCNLALIVARRSKIGTALKFSAWYDDMNAEWSSTGIYTSFKGLWKLQPSYSLHPKISVAFASRETTLIKYILQNINIYST